MFAASGQIIVPHKCLIPIARSRQLEPGFPLLREEPEAECAAVVRADEVIE
jgi:hypothetical protein